MAGTTAEMLIAELREHGVELRVAGERLRFRPRSAVSPELRAKMLANKREIMATLRQQSLYDVPAGWTPQGWAARLRYLAGVCTYPTRAAELAEWADGVSPPTVADSEVPF